MLDVHPPHEPIHGTRDFLLHLFTITVGLLIALGLEAGVEALHHRHQREEAETLIRQEMAANQKAVVEGKSGLKIELNAMTQLLIALETAAEGKPTPFEASDLNFTEGPMQDSAWLTAGTTGALNYMDYAEVQRFSAAYKEQDQLQAMELVALNDYLELVPILKNHGKVLTPARARDALPFARSAMGHLSGIYFIGAGTLSAYDEALKK